jgi:putative DNA primase/helicase
MSADPDIRPEHSVQCQIPDENNSRLLSKKSYLEGGKHMKYLTDEQSREVIEEASRPVGRIYVNPISLVTELGGTSSSTKGALFMDSIENDRTNVKLEAALNYAAIGWKVIPVHHVNPDGSCSCGRVHCDHQGKHPIISDWQNRCTNDRQTIEGWWAEWPQANVGIVCGASGIGAIDIDAYKGGEESLIALLSEIGFSVLPTTVEARTGSGGRHLIFRDGGNLIPSKVGLRPGIDIRADRGQIVVEPSSNKNGPYKWIISPFDMEPALIPDELVRRIVASNGDRTHKPISSGRATDEYVVEGHRNTHLTSLAGYMRHYGMERDTIFQELIRENDCHCMPPLDTTEVATIAGSVASYEVDKVDTRVTDVANADRFVERFAHELKYCPGLGWLYWNGRHWEQDDGCAMRAAKQIGNDILLESAKAPDNQNKKQLRKHARYSLNLARLRAMIALAEVDKRITLRVDKLDVDPYLFNCQNGTIDLRTGELLSHDPEMLITKISPVSYNPEATAPQFLQFSEKIMCQDRGLIDYLQLAFGYSMTGSVSEQIWFYFYGTGDNGKTTLLNTIMSVMGDYATQTTPDTWLAININSATARPDLARLPGVRLIVTSEPDDRRKLSENLLKIFTGGDPVTCRSLYKEEFTYIPVGKIFLSANYKLSVTGQDEGFWRRIKMIPFNVRIPESERDKNLFAKLQAEQDGILSWLVEGAVRWYRDGLPENQSVNGMTADYKSEMDFLEDFLNDGSLELDPKLDIETSELYKMYVEYCECNKIKVISQNFFGRQMTAKGFIRKPLGKSRRKSWLEIGKKKID